MTETDSTTRFNSMQTSDANGSASKWLWVLIVAILAAGAVLRYQMLEAFHLDFDESMHFQVAKEPDLMSAYEASKIHTHPPLIFLFYHYWNKGGTSEAFMRWPSLVFGVLALLIAYFWIREAAGRTPAVLGLVFLTFSPPMIRLSHVMRSYTFLLCLFFGALYFQERLVKKPSLRAVLGLTLCLALANLTHYSAPWFTLVLGIVVTVRVLGGQIPRRIALGWAAGQTFVLGICAWLYLSHVRGFVKSDTRDAMWSYWSRGINASTPLGREIKLMLVRTIQFMSFTFGTYWFLVPLALGYASWILVRSAREEHRPVSERFSRVLLVLLPFVIANALLCARVYPFGPTRHSIWVIPFVALAIGVSLAQCYLPKRRLTAVLGTLMMGFWIVSHSVMPVLRFETPMSIARMHETVEVFKKRIPASDVVIVDDATRNVLDYYMGRDELNPVKELPGGFREYHIGGYRLLVLPKFYIFEYSLRENWCEFLDCTETRDAPRFWVVYLGYDDDSFSLRRVGPYLPLVTSFQHWQVGMNQIIEFPPPRGCSGKPPKNKNSLAMH